jgi:hypothetical protein
VEDRAVRQSMHESTAVTDVQHVWAMALAGRAGAANGRSCVRVQRPFVRGRPKSQPIARQAIPGKRSRQAAHGMAGDAT